MACFLVVRGYGEGGFHVKEILPRPVAWDSKRPAGIRIPDVAWHGLPLPLDQNQNPDTPEEGFEVIFDEAILIDRAVSIPTARARGDRMPSK